LLLWRRERNGTVLLLGCSRPTNERRPGRAVTVVITCARFGWGRSLNEPLSHITRPRGNEVPATRLEYECLPEIQARKRSNPFCFYTHTDTLARLQTTLSAVCNASVFRLVFQFDF
jgi:hypothetical protein